MLEMCGALILSGKPAAFYGPSIPYLYLTLVPYITLRRPSGSLIVGIEQPYYYYFSIFGIMEVNQ